MNRQRITGFVIKETLQMLRDPSSILIAFVMPMIMMFLYGYGVSLDINNIKVGLVLEDTSSLARDLASSFINNRYFDVRVELDRRPLESALVNAEIRGFMVIPQQFSRQYFDNQEALVQVIADGSETNTANFVKNYAQGVVGNWLDQQRNQAKPAIDPPIKIENHVWFNSELISSYVLLPGAIAVILSLIGSLLTALVVAREWERGTMEAMMATPISINEIIIGKLAPYFLLGLGSMTMCVITAIVIFGIPFRGSFLILLFVTCEFLLASLAQGLLISTAAKNQFIAGQISMMVGFLPAFMLSGFLFEIHSMPWILQMITYAVPARYFVTILQTSFLTGVVWPIFIINSIGLGIIAIVFLLLVKHRIVKRLD
jgi:ABC-2 type transport system permease protein